MLRLGDALFRSEAPRACLLALGLTLAVSAACTTNHDALARQPNAGSGGGGSGGSSGFAGFGFGNTGNQAQGGRTNPDDEPAGDNVLTIVNGVVDASSVRICFARVDDNGETGELVGSPLPELGYAASTVLTQVDGFSLADDVIQPWLIAGELERIKKLDCAKAVALAQAEEAKVTPLAEAEAGGGQGSGGQNTGGAADVGDAAGAGGAPEKPPLVMPVLRARALPALPAGTVNIGRSILMVLSGCLGGAAYADQIDTSACGADYTPDRPTVEPIVVKLSRDIRFDKVGLQGLQASQPTSNVDIRVSGDKGAVALVFASGVGYGSIAPRPADTRFTPVELGLGQSNYGLQAVGDGGGVLFQEAWSDIFTASGIPTPVSARSYTAILLGPDPLLLKQGWWNASAFALVDNDPTRE
jgi:hypothetical protein